MSILTIVTESDAKNPVLRARSKEVADISDAEIQRLIKDMQETLAIAKNGIGIAASQVGRNLRLFRKRLSIIWKERRKKLGRILKRLVRRSRMFRE